MALLQVLVATVPGTLGSDMYHNLGVSGSVSCRDFKDTGSPAECPVYSANYRIKWFRQDSLASISDAIAKIVAEIQAMLNKIVNLKNKLKKREHLAFFG